MQELTLRDTRPPLALIVLALLALFVAAAVATRYSELELTQHAQQAHAGQSWDAASIASYMDEGGCQPTQYACPSQDFEIAYCVLNDDKAIGLVIGRTTRRIVTGFMAGSDYWRARC